MKIGVNEKRALAELIAHNVFHTECATEVWMSAGDAIASHCDDVSEAAQEAFGRRLTDREWNDVSKRAQPLVELVLYGCLRTSFSTAARTRQLRAAASMTHVHGPLKGEAPPVSCAVCGEIYDCVCTDSYLSALSRAVETDAEFDARRRRESGY